MYFLQASARNGQFLLGLLHLTPGQHLIFVVAAAAIVTVVVLLVSQTTAVVYAVVTCQRTSECLP